MARKFTANLDLPDQVAKDLTALAKSNDKAGVELPLEVGSENFPAYTTRSQREDFGRTLQHLCTLRGWTQAELGRRSGLSKQLVSSYWTGRSWPSPLNAGKLAHALGVKREDLIPSQAIGAMTGGGEPKMRTELVPNRPGFMLIELAAILPSKTVSNIITLVTDAANGK